MADLSVLKINGENWNIKDTSARGTANAVSTAQEYDRQQIAKSYGGRALDSVFSGEIGSTDFWTWLKQRSSAGDFSGMRVGDYKEFQISQQDNVNAQTVRARILHFDPYYNAGDTAKGHHIAMGVLAPIIVRGEKAVNTSYLQWNTTATNQGTSDEKHPYLCSHLHDWEINDFFPALPQTLQNAIMPQRVLLEERYSAEGNETEATGWSWADLGKIWSPSEMEVYGCCVWGTPGYSVGFDCHFDGFADTAARIAGGRVPWWLRSTHAGSASSACNVTSNGRANNYSATNDWLRPLPCFLIG